MHQHIVSHVNILTMIVFWLQDMLEYNRNQEKIWDRAILGLLSFSVEFMERGAARPGCDGLSWIMKRSVV